MDPTEPVELPATLRAPFSQLMQRGEVDITMMPITAATLYVLASAMTNPATPISRQRTLRFGEVLSSLRIVGVTDDETARDMIATAMLRRWLARPGYVLPPSVVGQSVIATVVAEIVPESSLTLSHLAQHEGELEAAPEADLHETEAEVTVIPRSDLIRLVTAVLHFRAGGNVFVGDDPEPYSISDAPSERALLLDSMTSPFEDAATLYVHDVRHIIEAHRYDLTQAMAFHRALIAELRSTLGGAPTRSWLASVPESSTPVDDPFIQRVALYILTAGDDVARIVLQRLETTCSALARYLTSNTPDDIDPS